MTKIIGFLITKENKQPKVDFFDVGIKTILIKYDEYNIYLWGVGDIENYRMRLDINSIMLFTSVIRLRKQSCKEI